MQICFAAVFKKKYTPHSHLTARCTSSSKIVAQLFSAQAKLLHRITNEESLCVNGFDIKKQNAYSIKISVLLCGSTPTLIKQR